MNALLLLVLAFEPSPNTPLPPDAELCIVRAELCVEQQPFPEPCGEDAMVCTCAEDFENCAQFISALQELTCRRDYVWCIIEPPNPESPSFAEWMQHCGETFKTCPTFAL